MTRSRDNIKAPSPVWRHRSSSSSRKPGHATQLSRCDAVPTLYLAPERIAPHRLACGYHRYHYVCIGEFWLPPGRPAEILYICVFFFPIGRFPPSEPRRLYIFSGASSSSYIAGAAVAAAAAERCNSSRFPQKRRVRTDTATRRVPYISMRVEAREIAVLAFVP